MADWKDALSALMGAEQQPEASGSDTGTPVQDKQQESQQKKEAERKEARQKAKKRVGVVYSTNPDFAFEDEEASSTETLPKNQQKLRLSMERAGRGGKTVTLVRGFVGTYDDLQSLCKLLKQKCAVGGSVTAGNGPASDAEIVIQGDQRARLLEILKKEGYTQTK